MQRGRSEPSLRIVTHNANDQRTRLRSKTTDDTPSSQPRKRPQRRTRGRPNLRSRANDEARVTDETPSRARHEARKSKPGSGIKPLSEGKKRDYGYGVPRWSPYFMPTSYVPEPHRAASSTYGAFARPENASRTLAPHLQLKQNKDNIREMKSWAVVDHVWELVGERPGWAGDLDFINDLPVSPTRVKNDEAPALSDDKKRDYGYGIPMWSPYYCRRRRPPARQ